MVIRILEKYKIVIIKVGYKKLTSQFNFTTKNATYSEHKNYTALHF